MKPSMLLLAAAPLAFALTAFRAPTPEVIVNDKTESTVFAGNSCNGDLISGTATIHTIISLTNSASGGFHFRVKQQFSNVKATGAPSGASYVGSQESTFEINLDAAGEETDVLTFKLIGQGKTPNVIAHFLFHLTVNANGDVTSTVSDFSVDCH